MYKFNEHMIKIKTWLNEAKIRYKNKVNGYRNKTDVMTLYRKKAKKLFLSEDFHLMMTGQVFHIGKIIFL